MISNGPRVVVAMSGGVDSSVAAALLVQQGYEVFGMAMRLWDGEDEETNGGCCDPDDFLDARRVANQLRIPFYVVDLRGCFGQAVVEPFVADYLAGRTPNPCVRCNQLVKFGALWERARKLGAEWIATGHYARIARDRRTGLVQLWRAVDDAKDQSYFLFTVPPEVLARCIFPIGELHKSEVRRQAGALGLAVAGKPESQEACFTPGRDYVSLVAQRAAAVAPGDIVDEQGRVIGRHAGVHHFTVGQRRRLGLGGGCVRYVTDIDAGRCIVRVGPRAATTATGLTAAGAVWSNGRWPEPGSALEVKIRSRFPPTKVRVETASRERFSLRAETELQAVTPGQAAVLYDGMLVVGGGWIERSPSVAPGEAGA